MKRALPPLTWLRAFEAAARHLSFTQAAQELHLTQTAISKQIKLLEQHLREPLFQRKPRSLVLTKAGAAYLPKVSDALERLAAGTEEVFGHRRAERLTVRATVSFAVNWLGPRLQRFYQQYPDIPIRIVSNVWNDALDQEHFDLNIRYGRGHWPACRVERLSWEVLTPLCSPALLQGQRPLCKPENLQHYNLLHVLGYEQGWARWLQAANISTLNAGQGLQFDTSLMAFEVAAHGGGVALGRSSIIQAELASGRLIKPFELAVPVDEAFYLVAPIYETPHPHSGVFRDWLISEAAAEVVQG